ncbi:hypothetical protein PanWU01x14_113290, partial [Parasponia andersonii]
ARRVGHFDILHTLRFRRLLKPVLDWLKFCLQKQMLSYFIPKATLSIKYIGRFVLTIRKSVSPFEHSVERQILGVNQGSIECPIKYEEHF